MLLIFWILEKNQLLKFSCGNASNKLERPQEINTRCFGEKREENPQGSFKDTTADGVNTSACGSCSR